MENYGIQLIQQALETLSIWLLVIDVIGVLLMVAFMVTDISDRYLAGEKNVDTVGIKRHRKTWKHREAEKTELRKQKERITNENFFEDRYYVPGFNANTGDLIYRGQNVPTEKAFEYYRKMDEMADTQIMQVYTEEI